MLLREIFEQHLLEAKRGNIPLTDYGYWIDAGGTFIPVEQSQHITVADRLLRLKAGNFQEKHRQIFNAGWIRVVFEPGKSRSLSSQMTTKVTKLAKQKLIHLLSTFKDQFSRGIFITIADVSGGDEHFDPPDAADKAIKWINQKV